MSKTATADTRKANWTVPPLGLYETPRRCSVSPGRRCFRAASCGLITAWLAAPGLNIRPCKILTRSAETPGVPLGLAKACTQVVGKPG